MPRINPPLLLALLVLLGAYLAAGAQASAPHDGVPSSRALLAAPGAGAPAPADAAPPAAGEGDIDQSDETPGGPPPGSGLLARVFRRHRRGDWKWDAHNIAGIVLSVLVSLFSSVDRECGAGLYMVLFAVLLDFTLRESVALTAFCVFLGSLGPGVASTQEAVLTERGPLAACDYATAILVLPCMYWGLSFGIILNAALPLWLLALLIVAALAVSNAELLISLLAMMSARKEIVTLGARIKAEAQALAIGASGAGSWDDGGANGSAAQAPAAAADAGAFASVPERAAELERLRARARQLHRRAARIEAVALLFPAFHAPTHHEMARAVKTDVETLFGDGEGALSTAVAIVGDRSGAGGDRSGAWGAPGKEQLGQASAGDLARGGSYQSTAPTGAAGAAPAGRCCGCKRWWALQSGFEFALVLKIVVLHLVTEFIRHTRAKPCTGRFWFMLVVMTGAVTGLLMAMAACWARKRLWRGPGWMEAHRQVVVLQRAGAGAGASDDEESASGAAAPKPGAPGAVSGADVAPAAGKAKHGAAQGPKPNIFVRFGRAVKAHSPFRTGAVSDAIKDTTHCVSTDGFASWQTWRVVAVELAAFPMAVLGSALGFPGGPFLSWLALALRIKPHVVAATSRFLVMAFTFGTFIAYIISGNLRFTYALAYGLINLCVAPIGLALFRRASLPSHVLLLVSLFMGVTAMVVLAVTEMAPWMRHALAHAKYGAPAIAQNTFSLARFCHGHQLMES